MPAHLDEPPHPRRQRPIALRRFLLQKTLMRSSSTLLHTFFQSPETVTQHMGPQISGQDPVGVTKESSPGDP